VLQEAVRTALDVDGDPTAFEEEKVRVLRAEAEVRLPDPGCREIDGLILLPRAMRAGSSEECFFMTYGFQPVLQHRLRLHGHEPEGSRRERQSIFS
jgi:hypothetical protein